MAIQETGDKQASPSPPEATAGSAAQLLAAREQLAVHEPLDADAAETQTLLAELASSQAEVQRMLQQHNDQAEELEGLKEKLAAELAELQEEAWRLEAYNELEVLKRQLEALNNLEADLDAAEAVLDAAEPGTFDGQTFGENLGTTPQQGRSPVPTQASPAASNVDGAQEGTDAEFDLAEVAEMQARLDAELAEMLSQLNVVRNEATAVSARKAALEGELKDLMALQQAKDDAVAAGIV